MTGAYNLVCLNLTAYFNIFDVTLANSTKLDLPVNKSSINYKASSRATIALLWSSILETYKSLAAFLSSIKFYKSV